MKKAFIGMALFALGLSAQVEAQTLKFASLPAGEVKVKMTTSDIKFGQDPTIPTNLDLTAEYGDLEQKFEVSAFDMSRTEVTQAQWFDLMQTNPSHFSKATDCPDSHVVLQGIGLCPSHPVENVTRAEIHEFLQRLTAKMNDGRTYSLPSELQFEYARRANRPMDVVKQREQNPRFSWTFSNSNRVYDVENNLREGFTRPVATKAPNPWGLYDLSGNVTEMTATWKKVYGLTTAVPASDETHCTVIRGQGVGNPPTVRQIPRRYNVRLYARLQSGYGCVRLLGESEKSKYQGFRVVRN